MNSLLLICILFLMMQKGQTIIQVPALDTSQILASDITHQILIGKASKSLNTSYLQRFQGEFKTQYFGKIFGVGKRALVSLPVRLSHKSCPILINIIFKVDTGSPISSLSTYALDKLFQNCPSVQNIFADIYKIQIAGQKFEVQESRDDYKTLNILGANFFTQFNCQLVFNYVKFEGGTFKILLQGSKQIQNTQKNEKKIKNKARVQEL